MVFSPVIATCSNVHVCVCLQGEQRKEKAVRLQQELTQKACIHHTKSLLKFYGFRPWRVFLKHVHLQQITARECCDKRLLQSHFYCWRHRRQDKERWRERCADNLHQRQVLRVHFQLWHKASQACQDTMVTVILVACVCVRVHACVCASVRAHACMHMCACCILAC